MPPLVYTNSSACGPDILLVGPREEWEKELEGGDVCSVHMSTKLVTNFQQKMTVSEHGSEVRAVKELILQTSFSQEYCG